MSRQLRSATDHGGAGTATGTAGERFARALAAKDATAFRALAERVGLEYFGVDCGETPDGELLIFETDVAMIVHSMDSPDLFTYKRPQMRKVFDAFRALLGKARG